MLPDGLQFRPLAESDAPALAAAYQRNREHFRPWDPVRPDAFYTEEGQRREVLAILEGSRSDRGHVWVLWEGDEVAGRIALNNIVRGPLQSGVLGYWVDRERTGKGLATAMVEHVAGEALRLGLHRLEAGTMLNNVASQAVLRRTGFRVYGVAERLLFIAGEWRDHVLFQRILHDGPARNPAPPDSVRQS